jgi:autotransporter-associated beta strand protein
LQGAGIQVTAGSAFISVLASGDLVFQNHSSAGNATIAALSGGVLTFTGNSDGGTARFITNASGFVDFSLSAGALGDSNVNAGSIEGAGNFNLGADQLTVGSNNLSTVVSGGIFGSFGSALTKVGTGTLTLAGNNVFTGAITIKGGAVDLASAGADPGGLVVFGAGAQETLRIESAALSGNNFSPLINNFASGDTIDLPSLPFVAGATASYGAFHTLSVTSGSTTVTFNDVELAGPVNQFVVLGDHTGGSRIMLAIVESRAHKMVDATHHPIGQPSPTNGPDVIVALGANDTVRGLGGDDSLVGGARGDRLYGGSGADNFIFQEISASPPKHPDVIWDFKHVQHDKIDLYDLRAFVPDHHPLVFIGAETFADYHSAPHHHKVFGMVRYDGGVIEVNVNHNLAPDFAIKMHNAPPVHGGDLIL